jgi:hypothetical protein
MAVLHPDVDYHTVTVYNYYPSEELIKQDKEMNENTYPLSPRNRSFSCKGLKRQIFSTLGFFARKKGSVSAALPILPGTIFPADYVGQ